MAKRKNYSKYYPKVAAWHNVMENIDNTLCIKEHQVVLDKSLLLELSNEVGENIMSLTLEKIYIGVSRGWKSQVTEAMGFYVTIESLMDIQKTKEERNW